jgi:hypothetical protein
MSADSVPGTGAVDLSALLKRSAGVVEAGMELDFEIVDGNGGGAAMGQDMDAEGVAEAHSEAAPKPGQKRRRSEGGEEMEVEASEEQDGQDQRMYLRVLLGPAGGGGK